MSHNAENDALPPIPLSDTTLDAIDHALGAYFDVDPDGTHHLRGADYQLATLLDFLAGAMGEDPNAEVLVPGMIPGVDPPEVVYDTRPHYSERDLVAALVAEVRRLRARVTPPADGCTCGRAWEGHPNQHAITCPEHTRVTPPG